MSGCFLLFIGILTYWIFTNLLNSPFRYLYPFSSGCNILHCSNLLQLTYLYLAATCDGADNLILAIKDSIFNVAGF
jgi:hypothetical protein